MGLAEILEAKIQAIVVKHVLDPVHGFVDRVRAMRNVGFMFRTLRVTSLLHCRVRLSLDWICLDV